MPKRKSFFLLSLLALLCLAAATPVLMVTAQTFFKKALVTNYKFVITPAKLGLTKTNWTVRENVVFRRDHWPEIPNYLGSRGFEFRYDLHPASKWQEFHTTINVYKGGAPDEAIEGKVVKQVKLAKGVFATIRQAGDRDNTMVISFVVGQYQVSEKIKFSTKAQAIPLLVKSARILLAELSGK